MERLVAVVCNVDAVRVSAELVDVKSLPLNSWKTGEESAKNSRYLKHQDDAEFFTLLLVQNLVED